MSFTKEQKGIRNGLYQEIDIYMLLIWCEKNNKKNEDVIIVKKLQGILRNLAYEVGCPKCICYTFIRLSGV